MSDLKDDTARMIAELGLGNKDASTTSKKNKVPKQAPPKALVVPALSSNNGQGTVSSIPKRLQRAMDKKFGKIDPKLVAKKERRQLEKEREKSVHLGENKKISQDKNKSEPVKANITQTISSNKNKGSAVSQIDNSKFSTAWWAQHNNSFGPQLALAEEGAWWDLVPIPQSLLTDKGQDKPSESSQSRVEKSALDSLILNVDAAFQDEVAAYQRVRSKQGGAGASADQKWMHDMITSGTLSDKVAALTLLVQESPLHELQTLDMLVCMALKPEPRTATLALEALKDLLVHNLLPDRPLVAFKDRDLGAEDWNLRKATVAWFEGQLKVRVEKIMSALEAGLRGTLAHFKRQCIEIVQQLLSAKPEQERRLLAMLVNKIGDPESNIAVKTLDALRRLLKAHPAMKGVVVREVQLKVSRPGTQPRTMYTGVVFLSQIPLDTGSHTVAVQLVGVYVSLFEHAVEAKELGSRLLAALLTGINKAFPYLKDIRALAAHTHELFRIAHSASFSSATQALTLLSHLALSDDGTSIPEGIGAKNDQEETGAVYDKEMRKVKKVVPSGDASEPELVTRFYRALYAKLLSEQVATRARNTAFLNLLFRSIKRDRSDLRSAAFLKRLIMCATHSSAPIAAGLLMLVSEVLLNRPKLTAMMGTVDGDTASAQGDCKGNAADESDDEHSEAAHIMGAFDGAKREPLYACSAQPSLWEASLLQHHFHPSVKAFSEAVLQKPHKITFAGDPTTDFTLTAFLNRFAFKNPKKSVSDKIRRAMPTPEAPLNTSVFAEKKIENVAPDKRFFHKFFGQRSSLLREGKVRDRAARKRRSASDDEDDQEDEGDDASELGSDFGERAIDRFADRLAKDMMDEHAAGADIDDLGDVDDMAADSESDDVDNAADTELDLKDYVQKKSGNKSNAISKKQLPEDSSSAESDPEAPGEGSGSDAEDSDADGEDGYPGLIVGGGSDSELDEDDSDGLPSRKRKASVGQSKGNKKKKGDTIFAEISADYEEQMDDIISQMGPTGERVAGGNATGKSKRGVKSRR